MTTDRRTLGVLALGIALGLLAGWIWAAPRYQFTSNGTGVTRGDVRTGEIVIYGLANGKAYRLELTREADKTR
jgi:hypothetical protein